LLERANQGAAFVDDLPAGNGMSSWKTVQTLLNIVSTFHFPTETWIFVNGVFTAQRYTLILVPTLLTSIATTMNWLNRCQLTNCLMMLFWSSTIIFTWYSFINCIVTLVFTPLMKLPVLLNWTVIIYGTFQNNL
jgi:hypothetical protein